MFLKKTPKTSLCASVKAFGKLSHSLFTSYRDDGGARRRSSFEELVATDRKFSRRGGGRIGFSLLLRSIVSPLSPLTKRRMSGRGNWKNLLVRLGNCWNLLFTVLPVISCRKPDCYRQDYLKKEEKQNSRISFEMGKIFLEIREMAAEIFIKEIARRLNRLLHRRPMISKEIKVGSPSRFSILASTEIVEITPNRRDFPPKSISR